MLYLELNLKMSIDRSTEKCNIAITENKFCMLWYIPISIYYKYCKAISTKEMFWPNVCFYVAKLKTYLKKILSKLMCNKSLKNIRMIRSCPAVCLFIHKSCSVSINYLRLLDENSFPCHMCILMILILILIYII